MKFYLVVTYCLTISLYLFGSLRASSLGSGGREGERGSTSKRACSQAIYLGELAMLEVIAPHSQIWPEYKVETVSCLCNVLIVLNVIQRQKDYQESPQTSQSHKPVFVD